MSLVSDIKLIITDTTLDLSRKAEDGVPPILQPGDYIPQLWQWLRYKVWDSFCWKTFLFNLVS